MCNCRVKVFHSHDQLKISSTTFDHLLVYPLRKIHQRTLKKHKTRRTLYFFSLLDVNKYFQLQEGGCLVETKGLEGTTPKMEVWNWERGGGIHKITYEGHKELRRMPHRSRGKRFSGKMPKANERREIPKSQNNATLAREEEVERTIWEEAIQTLATKAPIFCENKSL